MMNSVGDLMCVNVTKRLYKYFYLTTVILCLHHTMVGEHSSENCQGIFRTYITQYGSTVYIGIAMVYPH